MQGQPPYGEGEQRERDQYRLERILPELIKRALDAGYGKISEGPESVRQFVSELKLPKEVLSLLASQIDDTKAGLYRVVAKEVRDRLDHANLVEGVVRALTTGTLQIKAEIRFIPGEHPTTPTRPTPASDPAEPPATAAAPSRVHPGRPEEQT